MRDVVGGDGSRPVGGRDLVYTDQIGKRGAVTGKNERPVRTKGIECLSDSPPKLEI